MVDKVPMAVRLAQRVQDKVFGRYHHFVKNASHGMDITPPRGRHLEKFDKFLYIDRFYSDSMSRAANDLDPVGLSAAGYDLVIIDTPHYVRVKHIDRGRIFSVVHDMIPLNDPFYEQGWRRIFLSKMRATLALRGNLIFVSAYTKSLFHSLFPEHRPKRELVIYPSIPNDWVVGVGPAEATGRSAYLDAISRDRIGHRRERIRARAARLADSPEAQANLFEQIEASLPSWNGSLPYFATVTSDEPRKNVGIFCKIAPKFCGKANFVIIGQVDGNRHMDYEPELYPNLHFTGYLDDERKTDVMRHAAGVIFPSFSEGFGIPIVEGALFGLPVICSNLRVFHEVTRTQARRLREIVDSA
jgi:glycosyltransferase involved in cell wall biosynthesis